MIKNKLLKFCCINFWKISILEFPSGLVNCFNPLGHSGHDKLQAVVGSKDAAIGDPNRIGFFIILDNKNEVPISRPLIIFFNDMNFNASIFFYSNINIHFQNCVLYYKKNDLCHPRYLTLCFISLGPFWYHIQKE